MKTAALSPFVPPAVEKPACASCKTFTPDCLVPVGDGAKAMCWLCAHHVVEHDVCVEHAYTGECECTPAEIYPPHVLAMRTAAGAAFAAGITLKQREPHTSPTVRTMKMGRS